MEVMGGVPTSESIIKTLIELLEAQEQIKVTYQIREDRNEKNIKSV